MRVCSEEKEKENEGKIRAAMVLWITIRFDLLLRLRSFFLFNLDEIKFMCLFSGLIVHHFEW